MMMKLSVLLKKPIGRMCFAAFTSQLGLWIQLLCLLLFPWSVSTATDQSVCQFPARWSGTWFQSGIQRHIHIDRRTISTKGKCVEVSGDKFLIEDKKENLYRCIVMHEKHNNVLQYKEIFSERRESLDTLCSHITGDAALYSMFRVGATPVTCPFKGPFQFTYFRGGNLECKNPPSSIDVCTEDWRLLLRFQACPDVLGSESTVEELVCLAVWKEGSMRYLVGKLERKMATSEEDKYRCFVYDKNKEIDNANVGFQLAQSGDATCNGLATIEGSRTLKLTKGIHATGSCTFPTWMTNPQMWHTLDWKHTYHFGPRNSSFKVVNVNDVLVMSTICHDIISDNERSFTIRTHVTQGCNIGYVCMAFYQRSQHVIEMQMSNFTGNKDEACTSLFFDKISSPFVTLMTSTPKARQCPDMGKYNTFLRDRKRNGRDICPSFTSLKMGCNQVDTIELETDCRSERKVESYECHANWEENGTSYLITSVKGSKMRFCFVYTESDKIFQFSGLHDSCRRNIQPGSGGNVNFNLTSNGQCGEVSDDAFSSKYNMQASIKVIILTMLTIVVTINHLRFLQ